MKRVWFNHYIALNKLLGNDIEWRMDKREKTVSYIETPQIITE